MSEVTTAPDVSALDIPMDAWTAPFWEAAETGTLLLPKCGECGTFRWPPGPFCPRCLSQAVAWVPPGPPRLYSFTVVRQMTSDATRTVAPALVEFPEAGGIRIVAAIADAPVASLRIGAKLSVSWSQAANGRVPVFRLAD